ncbi:unnamed protein product [Cyclocybe aegerita]|uniref:AB hydrolase-1 domain-containing protein n=1 Tax=Cyclocybe aegerita TaxID=1973307 RepID=A0A8S0W913_CYCAE|nr:unnamed protein product [Cyclocybe aegerita]
MSTRFQTRTYTFDPRPAYPLLTVAKRYWRAPASTFNSDSYSPDSYSPDSEPLADPDPDPDALTLIFAHGGSFHKEQWEPTIDDLWVLLEGGVNINEEGKEGNGHGKKKRPKVREVWTIDAANHGAAAILNEGTLKLGYESIFGWEEYARSIHLLLSGLGTGLAGVDFSTHNLVGIGHSMGAVSLTLTLGYTPPRPFRSFILVEPMIMAPAFGSGAVRMLVSGGEKRRDIWPSRAEAYALLRARGTWKAWDERVLRLYMEHGLRDLPTLDYPDQTGVTLSCTKASEVACYRDPIGSLRLYSNLQSVISRVPTHLIYGAIDDYLPEEVKRDVVENAAGGLQNLGSFARVESAGHLVPQLNPRGLASKIYDALVIISNSNSNSGSRRQPSRL